MLIMLKEGRGWLVLQTVLLVALALLNVWISWVIYEQHPFLAVPNAAMAVFLLVLVSFAWWSLFRDRRK
jgi:uncharacterized membrane protein YqjE